MAAILLPVLEVEVGVTEVDPVAEAEEDMDQVVLVEVTGEDLVVQAEVMEVVRLDPEVVMEIPEAEEAGMEEVVTAMADQEEATVRDLVVWEEVTGLEEAEQEDTAALHPTQ